MSATGTVLNLMAIQRLTLKAALIKLGINEPF
jgi:hypothetical protein